MQLQIHNANFRTEDIEAYGMGAGIVPVAIDPDGEFRLLLGRERYLPHWKGSCRWSGFEGSRKPEESLHVTAAREYAEESLGVVSMAGRSHWLRIVVRILHEKRAERYHATYAIPVEWDADAPRRFQQTRLDLEHIDRAMQEWRYARPTSALPFGVDVGAVEGGAEAARVELFDLESQTARIAIFEGDAARSVLEWRRLRERCERALRVHPSVRMRRRDGWLQEVGVTRDYLEKDQVRWWSETELRQVMAERGHHGSNRFRPYFLPVLQTLLEKLRARPAALITSLSQPRPVSPHPPAP